MGKPFGITMWTYGIKGVALRRVSVEFDTADQLAEFYNKNKKQSKKRKKKNNNESEGA